MKIGEKVKFTYKNKYGISEEKTLTLSDEIVPRDEMTDEQVCKRLIRRLQDFPLETLIKKGYIFAARNLLKLIPEATEIKITAQEPQHQNKDKGQAGGAIVILAIVAFIAAVICLPLLVMLGMRQKLLLKGLYKSCRGDAYKKFVKIYTFIGIGLYAVVVALFAVDKIFELNALSGPAFGVLFLGGIAYFIISLLIIKKKYMKPGESLSFSQLFNKDTKNEDAENEATENDEPENANETTDQPDTNTAKPSANTTDVIYSSAVIENANTAAFSHASAENNNLSTKEISRDVQSTKTVTREQKPSQAKKNYKNALFIVLIIIFAFIAGAFAFWLINKVTDNTPDPNTPSDSTPDSDNDSENQNQNDNNENESDQTNKINVNDYVGYWHIINDPNKELTVHNGGNDTVYFSLWYKNQDEINNIPAQLQDNVASFSYAGNGAMMKGTLTFYNDSIVVHITQSTAEGIPLEMIEFTEQHMMSWIKDEEEDSSSDTEAPDENENIETLPPVETPFLFKVRSEGHYIYSHPTYDSNVKKALKIGAFTIVEQQYDSMGNSWGKLKSGTGWICLSDIQS